MKKNIILGLAVAVMAVTSFTVSADSQYPASDFEPKVIYIDKSVAAAPSSSAASTAVPCPSNTAASTATAQPVADEVDPKYPAANFQPKVIYP